MIKVGFIGLGEQGKPMAVNLAKDGFDPANIADALFLDDPRTGAYVRLDGTLYKQIVSGEVRL